jgi:hypothetical protein
MVRQLTFCVNCRNVSMFARRRQFALIGGGARIAEDLGTDM